MRKSTGSSVYSTVVSATMTSQFMDSHTGISTLKTLQGGNVWTLRWWISFGTAARVSKAGWPWEAAVSALADSIGVAHPGILSRASNGCGSKDVRSNSISTTPISILANFVIMAGKGHRELNMFA
ncbi:unnamed protein product [Linum tenue]|uniref:Uncharacterized protein n=1 Tax=Linum tenue TaxID=586396 RepID=A0AAV0LNK8_9ROSI|nr:unnamed protein product [Linum tenue]